MCQIIGGRESKVSPESLIQLEIRDDNHSVNTACIPQRSTPASPRVSQEHLKQYDDVVNLVQLKRATLW